MDRGHPGEPDGESVLPQTEQPIAEGLGASVDSGAGAGLCAVGSKSDAAGKKRGTPPPLRRSCDRSAISEKRGGGRTDQRVDGVPDGVDVGNFVGEKFNRIESERDSENPRMRENLEGSRQMEDAVPLKKAKRRDGGVEIHAGRKSGAECETKGLQRVHILHGNSACESEGVVTLYPR